MYFPEAEAYHPGTDWNHLGSSSFYDGRMTESMETRLVSLKKPFNQILSSEKPKSWEDIIDSV